MSSRGSFKMKKYHLKKSLQAFTTLILGRSNPWIIFPILIFPNRKTTAKIRLKKNVFSVSVSGKDISGLYYVCILRNSISLEGRQIIPFESQPLRLDTDNLLRGRKMEMIYYAGHYGFTVANYDSLHYIVQTREQISFIVKKDEDIGNIGEVFVDEVYGKLIGDIHGKNRN